MAEHQEGSDGENDLGYKPPAEKSMGEILKTDEEDESLKKYKKQLLGNAPESSIPFPDDSRSVIVNKLALVTDDKEMEMDLSSDLTMLKKKPFIVKEGAKYRIKIYFYVQREIVTGLQFKQTSYRKGFKVDKMNLMVGSYGPKMELQHYITPVEEAPQGVLARGSYTIKSLFTDDDKNEHLKWEWTIDIKKDWSE